VGGTGITAKFTLNDPQGRGYSIAEYFVKSEGFHEVTQMPYNFAEIERQLPFARVHHNLHTAIGTLLFN